MKMPRWCAAAGLGQLFLACTLHTYFVADKVCRGTLETQRYCLIPHGILYVPESRMYPRHPFVPSLYINSCTSGPQPLQKEATRWKFSHVDTHLCPTEILVLSDWKHSCSQLAKRSSSLRRVHDEYSVSCLWRCQKHSLHFVDRATIGRPLV